MSLATEWRPDVAATMSLPHGRTASTVVVLWRQLPGREVIASGMNRVELETYRARWALVNRVEVAELRATPPALKLRQLAALMASAGVFSHSVTTDDETGAVYERWQRLRRAAGVA